MHGRDVHYLMNGRGRVKCRALFWHLDFVAETPESPFYSIEKRWSSTGTGAAGNSIPMTEVEAPARTAAVAVPVAVAVVNTLLEELVGLPMKKN